MDKYVCGCWRYAQTGLLQPELAQGGQLGQAAWQDAVVFQAEARCRCDRLVSTAKPSGAQRPRHSSCEVQVEAV